MRNVKWNVCTNNDSVYVWRVLTLKGQRFELGGYLAPGGEKAHWRLARIPQGGEERVYMAHGEGARITGYRDLHAWGTIQQIILSNIDSLSQKLGATVQ